MDKDQESFRLFPKECGGRNTEKPAETGMVFRGRCCGGRKNERQGKGTIRTILHRVAKQAIDGDADAMYRMGDIYQYGFPQLGIPVYYQQAVEWYEKAANKGNMYAQTSLGILYYLGLGVPKNYTKTAEWYKKAAEQGDASAMYNLAGSYRLGREWNRMTRVGCKYNQKAANMDMPEAQAELAGMYYRGTGVEQGFWSTSAENI